ncbi:MAG TPA: hypothetical protein DCF82_01025, partial [Marinobacter hydrocarbonoclasticus]|nr:hypothetical protein [Marinobacter nauticus]
ALSFNHGEVNALPRNLKFRPSDFLFRVVSTPGFVKNPFHESHPLRAGSFFMGQFTGMREI